MTRPEVRRVTEARTPEALPGDRTMGEFREVLTNALKETFGASAGSASPSYLYIEDCTDSWAVYELEGPDGCKQFRVEFTMADDGTVTFGDPVEVEEKTTYEPVTESAVRVESGRVLEAKGADSSGGRVFAVQIVVPGTSRNGIRYPASVLEAAAPLYEGAKAYDRHRTVEELRSGTVTGLVGHYENVAANASGITADLHVLPSMGHIAEALDASIQAQDKGLPPVVGISHDVQAALTPAVEGGRRIQEATAIRAVLSADVVADPSAGGRATRVVAGGIGSDPQTTTSQEDTMTLKQLLSLLRQAEAADRDGLLQEHAAVIEAAGYTADEVVALIGVTESPEAPGGAASTAPSEPAAEPEGELAHATESLQGRMLIKAAVSDAGLEDSMIPVVTEGLGARFTEAELVRTVAGYQRVLEGVERRNLTPRAGHVQVTGEDADKKRDKLLATFEGDFQGGYHSIQEAYIDITGLPASAMFTDDLAATIVRESYQGARYEGQRVSESLATGSWGEILADVMNKRVVAEYNRPNLQAWRQLVTVAPVGDFRSQKLVRMGGYGVLPTVAESAPYQPLTSPGDEQATYTPTKKGGTEDFTYEMAKNDDLRKLVAIPAALGRAGAMTIYRAVFDLFPTNPTLYDSVALFHASHANTASAALSQTNLSAGRKAMRKQAAYGDSYDVLSLVPKYLLVPSDLEELAFQLCTSAVAVPATPAGPSNTPNLHQGLTPLVVDYWSDTNDWYLQADPSDCPTIEVGFMDGRQEPETFVQDNPAVGSVFNADKITYKIRHIWGLGIVDYRGFYRGAQ